MKKKLLLCTLCLVTAFSSISAYASEEFKNIIPEKVIELRAGPTRNFINTTDIRSYTSCAATVENYAAHIAGGLVGAGISEDIAGLVAGALGVTIVTPAREDDRVVTHCMVTYYPARRGRSPHMGYYTSIKTQRPAPNGGWKTIGDDIYTKNYYPGSTEYAEFYNHMIK